MIRRNALVVGTLVIGLPALLSFLVRAQPPAALGRGLPCIAAQSIVLKATERLPDAAISCT